MKLRIYLAALSLPLSAAEPVRYELKFPDAAYYEAEVRATFSGVKQPSLEVPTSRSSLRAGRPA